MKVISSFFLGLFLTFCSHEPTVLQAIKEKGVLRVITYNNPTTFHHGMSGDSGFEHDLANRFAKQLGVKLEPVYVDSSKDVIPALRAGKGDIAAAGLLVTAENKKQIRFSSVYQQVKLQLVYRTGTKKPESLRDIGEKSLEVMAGSPELDFLKQSKSEIPGLNWQVNKTADHTELLNLVNNKLFDFTIAKDNEIALIRRYHPELKVAFDIDKSKPMAWGFPLHTDDSLYVASIHFFNKLKRSGELDRMVERYYQVLKRFDYVSTRSFKRHVAKRLPSYEKLFKQAAKKTGINWHLLAAISYQESHWKADAVSPTGVRGLMMLTKGTAKQMGVKNRTVPQQSIDGGARYFKHVKKKIPKRIDEPDRTWLALATYNIGYGHLEDARKLTDKQGGNPDRWLDVKKHLPLLSQEKWHKKTRYGFARGGEAVRYVENIRRYYDLLVWLEKQQETPLKKARSEIKVESPVL